MTRLFSRFVCAALLAAFPLLLDLSAAGQFEARGAFVAQESPSSIAVGDFNHDGKLDLAVANGCCPDGGVSILLGNGDGTFRPPVSYEAGVGPISIVAADFNRDGNLDLAVANSLSDYVSILLGNGDGTFQPATQVPLSSFPAFVAVGDFNGDGIPDLVTINSGASGGISVLLGNGDGTFESAIITQPPFVVAALGVGDFNGDGKLDLVTAGEFGSDSTVNILLGNGNGTFRQGASYSGDTSPVSIAVADFRNNGKLDFAVANFEGVGVGVWLGNGDGTFQPGVNYAAPFPIWVTSGRLTGGGVDLVAANFGSSLGPAGATVFAGNGDGTFQPGDFYPEGRQVTFVAASDFNGDHKPDLVLADYNTTHVTILLNTGAASFSPTSPVSFPVQLVGTASAPQTVKLTNSGTGALSIASITVHSPFHLTDNCGKSVAPGATCDLGITFVPTAQGSTTGLMTLIDSASSRPQVIELFGMGTVMAVAPQSLSFGNQKVGTKSPPQQVVVTNQGSGAVTISGIKFMDARNNYHQGNNCPAQLNAGASCMIGVTFDPKNTGPQNGMLYIDDNGGGGRQGISLSGTGD
ncbi:MAG TPA: FG-GAP-like repeat-containing protein [Candidatus Binatia bacterium]|nr:FG-GAP-like repeat-containing protein [Candidatus Binatia bacterium]